MKYKKIIIVFLLQTVSLSLIAQKERVRGIYKTSDDFIKGNLSFDNNCSAKKTKIKLNDFFVLPYITIKQGDSSLKILKSDIFAYEKCNNQIFRFRGIQELLLLDVGGPIIIYKLPNKNPPVGSRTNITNYYFSISTVGAVQKLTIKNLKTAFSENKNFQQLIDKNFKYNTDLAGFDKVNKMYYINLFLKESLR